MAEPGSLPWPLAWRGLAAIAVPAALRRRAHAGLCLARRRADRHAQRLPYGDGRLGEVHGVARQPERLREPARLQLRLAPAWLERLRFVWNGHW
jgi:hypothetical protein